MKPALIIGGITLAALGYGIKKLFIDQDEQALSLLDDAMFAVHKFTNGGEIDNETAINYKENGEQDSQNDV